MKTGQQASVSVLALAFWTLIIIKLCGFAEISWWIVFLPVLIPFAFVGALLAFAAIVAGIGVVLGR